MHRSISASASSVALIPGWSGSGNSGSVRPSSVIGTSPLGSGPLSPGRVDVDLSEALGAKAGQACSELLVLDIDEVGGDPPAPALGSARAGPVIVSGFACRQRGIDDDRHSGHAVGSGNVKKQPACAERDVGG